MWILDVPPPAEERVVSSDAAFSLAGDRSITLTLTRAKVATETAFARYHIFAKAEARMVEVQEGGKAVVRCRWVLTAHLQRELCLRSISGVFACSDSVIQPLGDKEEAFFTPSTPEATCDLSTPAVAASRQRFTDSLIKVSDARFEEDLTVRLLPQLKAGGLTVRRPSAKP